MNDKTGGSRGPRRAAALTVVAAVAVLTACGGSPSSSGGSATAGRRLPGGSCLRAVHANPRRAGLPRPQTIGRLQHQHQRAAATPTAPRRGLMTPASTCCLAAARERQRRCAGRRPARLAPRRLTAWAPCRVTRPGSSGSPTASSRCWIAGSTAAASRWRCPRRPKRDRQQTPAVTDIRQDVADFDQPVRTAPGTDPGQHDPGGLVRLAVAGQRGGGGGHRAGARRRPGRHHP